MPPSSTSLGCFSNKAICRCNRIAEQTKKRVGLWYRTEDVLWGCPAYPWTPHMFSEVHAWIIPLWQEKCWLCLVYAYSAVQMLTVENSTEENSVLSYGPRPESMQCVWLVKKGPGQKVLKGHMTHSLSWENNSVPVPLTVGFSRKGTIPCCGEVSLTCVGLFNHLHTPGYWVSSDAPSGI